MTRYMRQLMQGPVATTSCGGPSGGGSSSVKAVVHAAAPMPLYSATGSFPRSRTADLGGLRCRPTLLGSGGCRRRTDLQRGVISAG
jgi:hypothetical protein